MGYWFVGIFFILFALMLIVSAVGMKVIEQQRKRKVSGMLLTTQGGLRVRAERSILRDATGDESWSELIKSIPLYEPIKNMLDLAALDKPFPPPMHRQPLEVI